MEGEGPGCRGKVQVNRAQRKDAEARRAAGKEALYSFHRPPGTRMLNYIWAGLIILSLGFALAADIGDLRRDTYRNGRFLPVSLTFTQSYSAGARRLPVTVRLDSA